MITIEGFRESAYLPFRDLDEKEQKKISSCVKYIEHLASVTGTNIVTWPLDTVFKVGDEWPSDRKKINKTFFEYREAHKEEIVQKVLSSPAICEIVDIVRKEIENSDKRRKEILHRRANRYFEEAIDYMRSYENRLAKGLIEKRLAESPLVSGNYLLEQMQMIVENDFYSNLRVETLGEPSTVCVDTKPVVLTYFNTIQSRNIAVPLGSFKVEIYLLNNDAPTVRCRPIEDNVFIVGCPHPHVSSSGEICFGAAKQNFIDLITSFKFGEVLSLVQLVLTEYCDDQPYFDLDAFEKALRRGADVATSEDAEESDDFDGEDNGGEDDEGIQLIDVEVTGGFI